MPKTPDELRLDKIKTFLKMRYGRNLSDVHDDMEFLIVQLEQHPSEKTISSLTAKLQVCKIKNDIMQEKIEYLQEEQLRLMDNIYALERMLGHR